MVTSLPLRFSAVLFIAMGLFAAAKELPAQQALPPLSGYSLEKKHFTLPADLTQPLTALLLIFESSQQPQADTWKQEINTAKVGNNPVGLYYLPVYSRESVLYRWWINSSMRSNIDDQQQRSRTIPLYTNQTTLRKTLDIEDESQVLLLLVDRSGVVKWRSAGALNPGKQREFEEYVRQFSKEEQSTAPRP